ncbi:3-(3-hydroxyphenyl)propionate hydroxylase [Ktedonosporobacter rubrisoli]|uniref:3-(3-hydroxyphenyl)propionate hydroxylase n=2 Tax=Ktedonosporobacter rubrisoli TaxID=2509675 RepID=A0A4P6JM20_KTERU|nr:3-(3-hydroxyphenyl)propionate hydroxylase [Ktedonosporobacter rubrisoli]
MEKKSSVDVLIIGAGPVGLTLANSLARCGVSVRIIEQGETLQREVRAKGLKPRTEEIFEDLGVLAKIHVRGQRNPLMRFYQRERLVRELDPASEEANQPTADAPYRGTLWIGQNNTQAVLQESLAQRHVQVEFDSHLSTVTQQDGNVLAQVTHAGETEMIQARYLVGCDGGHSSVRHLGGFSFLGETLEGECYLNAGVELEGLDPHTGHYWLDAPEGLLGLTYLRYDQQWVFQARLSSNADDLSAETCQRIFDERTGLPHVKINGMHWASLWRPNIRMVEQYRHGRIFLAGDAAHVHSGAGGQGMNTGIGDAYNLGWKLAAVLHGAPEDLLESYHAERFPVAQGVLASTTSFHEKLTRPNSGNTQNFIKASLSKDADLSQLGITYRGGPLACDIDDATGIRAGDRAPDSPFIFASNGQRGRLFELFRGTHFTLLTFADGPVLQLADRYKDIVHTYNISRGVNVSTSSDHALLDIDGYAYHFYGIRRDAVILVRPDGYIGLTAGGFEVQPINAYLHKVTGR